MVQSRLRSNVVLSSDDDEPTSNDVPKSNAKAATNTTRPAAGVKANNTKKSRSSKVQKKSSAQSSPKKSNAAPGESDQSGNGSAKSLRSFFGPAAKSRVQPAASVAEPTVSEVEEPEDIDDDFDQSLASKTRTQKLEKAAGSVSRKRSLSATDNEKQDIRRASSTCPKFLKTQHRAPPQAQASTAQAASDARSWNELYAPRGLEELAVHHKKVSDVRQWLEGVWDNKLYQRLLVLKGPAGTGKSTTISVLAGMAQAAISEWHNPDLLEVGSYDYASLSSQFAEFLSRTGQFRGLEMVKAGRASQSSKPHSDSGNDDSLRRIILVEELPSIAGSSSTALTAFRTQILQFLASSTSVREASHAIPFVLCISESVLASSDSSNNITAHRLLGRDIMHHPATTVIEFNPVAPTIISKALKSALQKHTQSSGRAQPVSPAVLKQVAEIGDIRNAVATLEYLCKNLDVAAANALPVRAKTKTKQEKTTKSSKQAKAQQTSGQDVMSLISMRESTLGLFHAVGKVVYNKREDSSEEPVFEADPNLQQRPAPVLGADALLAAAGTDSSTFLSALHENYILSCYPAAKPTDTEATLASVEGCLEALGEADILGTNTLGHFEGARPTGFVSEGLRQDEIAFQVGVRGIQWSLPYPVKRLAADAAGQDNKKYRPDVHRMFYPNNIKLWRKREEIKDALDCVMQQAIQGHLTVDRGGFLVHDQIQGGMKDFPKQPISQPGRMPKAAQATASRQPDPRSSNLGEDSSNLATSQPSRLVSLLEHLPYYLNIASQVGAPQDTMQRSTRLMEDVGIVVRLKGLNIQRDDDSDEEDAPANLNADPRFNSKQRTTAFSNRGFGNVETMGDDVEKLVLSDDDIVDD